MSTRTSGRISGRNVAKIIPESDKKSSTLDSPSPSDPVEDTSTAVVTGIGTHITPPCNVTPEKRKKKKKHKHKKTKDNKVTKVARTTKVPAKKAAKPKQIFWDEIFSERAGPDGSYVVIIVKQKSSGHAGYIHHLLKALENNPVASSLKSESAFDCRISTTLFLRQSHDINKRVGIGYGNSTNLHRIGFLANPNLSVKLKSKDPVHMELLTRNECEKVLLKTAVQNTSNKVTHYMAWDQSKHSTTTNPYRSLDEIFIDETVDVIMTAYALVEGFNRLDVYKQFKQNGISGYYSRSKTTGMYSVYAQEHFGYPPNSTTNGEDSGSESSSDDDNDSSSDSDSEVSDA